MNNISKKWMKWIPLFTLAALCIGFAGGGAATKAETAENHKIADGVYIGNVYVGGMTEEEAVDAISAYAQSVDDAVLTLNANGKSVEVSAQELGITFQNTNAVQEALAVGRNGNLIKRYKDKKDLENGSVVIEMPLDIDREEVASLLEEKADELDQKAVDSTLTRENGSFVIVEGAQGIEVDVDASIDVIKDYLDSDWDGKDGSVELTAEVVEPRGTKEELSKIKDLLGSYTTNYSSSGQNRCDNITNATSKINGTVLYPGDEFSVYEAIGPLDASNGYELAGAYENGQTVQSYGGGVCQVSTTLYNAAILAELEITERSNHSMIVTYVKPSMDAAIAGDYKDLKFVNNQDTPIYIEGYTQGKNVSFNIFGQETRPSNRKVSYESEVVSEQDPGTQFVATGDPVGYIATSQEKHTGYVAKLWKVVTVDGVEESREEFNKSTYKGSDRVVTYGTAGDPTLSENLRAAIAAQDEALADANVAAANAAAAAAAPAQ